MSKCVRERHLLSSRKSAKNSKIPSKGRRDILPLVRPSFLNVDMYKPTYETFWSNPTCLAIESTLKTNVIMFQLHPSSLSTSFLGMPKQTHRNIKIFWLKLKKLLKDVSDFDQAHKHKFF